MNVVKIFCEPCSFKGEGVMTESGIVCPICGEHIYDSVTPEEYEEIDF